MSASTDKTLKLWDVSIGEPKLMAQKNPEIGLVHSSFLTLCSLLDRMRGAKEVAVWDIMSEKAVADGCHGVL